MGSEEIKLENMLSPLTGSTNLNVIDVFEVEKIIELYKKQINIDVTRYFDKLDKISLLKCNDTGYLFYTPFSIIGDDMFYKELSSIRTNYYSERWEHKKALRFLKKEDKILEIGSGFGTFIKLLRYNQIYDVKGLELNPHAVNKCKEEKLNVENYLIEVEASTSIECYDAVCFFQVLEHITKVYDFIDSSLKTLKKGGQLIIGVPNNNPYLFISDKWHTLNLPPHHAGLWNEKSLESLEKVFPIKLKKIEFEPLVNSYEYFVKIQIDNSKYLKKLMLKALVRVAPKLLNFFYCKLVNGRNVLAVFVKQ